MSLALKAIETVYNGYRFRSRLEARWAVFFDALGVKYEYEKEGYDLDGTWYLPDFRLPELERWIEIKGQYPTKEEINKMLALASASKSDGIILWGDMPTSYGDQPVRDRDHWIDCSCVWIDNNPQIWTACKNCGRVDITWSGRSDYIKGCTCDNTKYWVDEVRLKQAYTAARQARFEHGEKPRNKASGWVEELQEILDREHGEKP